MKIYVGRWDLFNEVYEGIWDLENLSPEEVEREVAREADRPDADRRIAVYTPKELEAEFNNDIDGSFNTETYWMRII